MSNENIHSLWSRGTPLAAVCQRCGRRSLIPITKVSRWGGKGDMTPVTDITKRLKCQSCNLKQTHAFVPRNKEWAESWLNFEIIETPGVD